MMDLPFNEIAEQKHMQASFYSASSQQSLLQPLKYSRAIYTSSDSFVLGTDSFRNAFVEGSFSCINQ